MTQDNVRAFTVELTPIGDEQLDLWTSEALSYPGASINQVFVGPDRAPMPFERTEGAVRLNDAQTPVLAALSITPSTNPVIELEERKLAGEERWKRRTFTWTIASSIITAAVAITVAVISTSGRSDTTPKGLSVTSAPVSACRDSLQRLATLSNITDQTVDALRTAIARHNEACDDVLIDVLSAIGQ